MIKNFKNENLLDRYIRFILSYLSFILGYFWVSGFVQILFFVFSFVFLFTSVTGFCAMYRIFNFSTNKTRMMLSKIKLIIFSLLTIFIFSLIAYVSIFYTKKIFLDDYNRMNNFYKQTLFFTGQNKRDEAVSNYSNLVTEYTKFENKYTVYHPYSIKGDDEFNNDLNKISQIILRLKEVIVSGDLKTSHLKLEEIRPIFQDILKRNNFSLFAISLVDFHDAMEKIITASDKKDSTSVINTYIEVNDKLKVIEDVSNDEEIQNIRQKLEELLSLAKSNEAEKLSAKAQELKSAFVKVYLKRG